MHNFRERKQQLDKKMKRVTSKNLKSKEKDRKIKFLFVETYHLPGRRSQFLLHFPF